MTGYVSCCCRGEVYGWRVHASSVIRYDYAESFTGFNGATSTRSRSLNQLLSVELERSDILRLVDRGSSVSYERRDDLPGGIFIHDVGSDFLDLNEDSGQTWTNGDPIFRTPATLDQVTAVGNLVWSPTSEPIYNLDCLGLTETTPLARKTVEKVPIGTTPPPFDQSPWATWEIFRETNQFGQPPEETFQFRSTPSSGIGFVPRTGPAGVWNWNEATAGTRYYRNDSSAGQASLADLGIDSGPLTFTEDPTNLDRFPEFSLVIDGETITRQELLQYDERVLCLFRSGQSIQIDFVQRDIFSPGLFDEYEVSWSGFRDNRIESYEILTQ